MLRVRARQPADRRQIASTWLKRQVAARLAFVGLVVLVAVCFALGAVGIAVGCLVLAAIAVVVQLERRRRWRQRGRLPGTIPW
jgi:4-hydroxybenzoate polyprenyltransferase